MPPRPARRRGARAPAREHAQPGRAPRRPARADRGAPARGAAHRGARASAAACRRSRPRWTSSTATRSGVVRAALAALPDGRYEAVDILEPLEGTLEIRAAVTIAGDEVEIDFAGTSPQHDGNLNCPRGGGALRMLLRRPLPDVARPSLVGRCLCARHRSTAPEGSLVNARSPAAVVAGNTETSSRIVDVVFAAFGQALAGAGAGAGDDEQRHVREPRVHLLRDDRAAARAPARRRTGRAPSMWRCRTR